jgi:hypothetical protein
MQEVGAEEIFRWIASLSESSKSFVLCAVGEPKKMPKPAPKLARAAPCLSPSEFAPLYDF